MSARLGAASPPAPLEAVSDMAETARAPLRLGIFENINLLRAFAALSVVVYHVIEHGRWSDFPVEGPLVTFRVGWLGVDLFFVISGFVITYSALVLHRNDPGRFARQYWRRRLTRIVPLYLLTMALWIAFVIPGFFSQPFRAWGWQLATHFTFTHSFWTRTHGAIDGVNWTLAVEMQFYLAVALLVRWIDRTPGWRIWLYGTVIACAWRGAMFVLHGPSDIPHTFVSTQQLPGSLDEFGAGIFLAKLVVEGRRVRGEPWTWIAVGAILGWITMAIYWRYASYWDIGFMVTFWRGAFAACVLCVVAAAVRLPQVLASRWLRPLDYLGEISYGIYLWHLFAIQLVIYRLGWTAVPALLAVVTLTIAAASASWHAFEKPFMALARRKSA